MLGFCARCDSPAESVEGFECPFCQSSLQQVVEEKAKPKVKVLAKAESVKSK